MGESNNVVILMIVEEKYIEMFRPTMMEAVYLWSKGKSFKEVSEVTDVFEGSIVR